MKHQHRPIEELNRERGFSGPVPYPVRENQMAHGWATLYQKCRCGYVRQINANGPHREVGQWHNPSEQ